MNEEIKFLNMNHGTGETHLASEEIINSII